MDVLEIGALARAVLSGTEGRIGKALSVADGDFGAGSFGKTAQGGGRESLRVMQTIALSAALDRPDR
jgi:hypothetical protein